MLYDCLVEVECGTRGCRIVLFRVRVGPEAVGLSCSG